MLIKEVVSAEAKLDLWRLISNSVWNTLDAQARAELAAKAAARKPRRAGARTAKPRPPVGPVKPAVAAAKPQSEPTGKPPPEQRTQPQPVVPKPMSLQRQSTLMQALPSHQSQTYLSLIYPWAARCWRGRGG